MTTKQTTTISSRRKPSFAIAAALLAAPLLLSACNSTSEVLSHGYQVNEDTLALVPVGSSREQVLLSLGTPSTTSNQANGNETFYYISQRKARRFAFEKPRVVDQRVLAIYMSEASTVERIANYGMKDGKVFDFVARVTPTGGKDLSFISQLLSGVGSFSPFGGR
ncbi:MAG: outer membrane protein assembly factor BamE [Rhizobiaceae bacterium]|nr:outer membrane protein assembly factor BamE [Hyphomicrobiales bacterium]NRB32287.1 outer membrane protein assembly factor BamE [Rhizobiaceae bacterium]